MVDEINVNLETLTDAYQALIGKPGGLIGGSAETAKTRAPLSPLPPIGSRRSSKAHNVQAPVEDLPRRPSAIELMAKQANIAPKVQMAHSAYKRLIVERRRRIYNSMQKIDFGQVLEKAGIMFESGSNGQEEATTSTIGCQAFNEPTTLSIRMSDEQSQKWIQHRNPKFPISAFDDETFEERELQDWVRQAGIFQESATDQQTQIINIVMGGRAWVSAAFGWQKGWVTAFDTKTGLWNFHLASATVDLNIEPLWIPRVLVCFDAEDPFRFAERVSAACRLRYYVEAQQVQRDMFSGSYTIKTSEYIPIINSALKRELI
jgi:hypothetical protein